MYIYVIFIISYMVSIEIWLSKKTRLKALAKKLASF